MTEVDKKKIKDIIHTIGLNNNMKDEDVRNIIESQFRFTSKIIKELNLSNLSKEQIDNLKTNFNYKYIGKLYTNSTVVERHKKKEEYSKDYIENGRKKES